RYPHQLSGGQCQRVLIAMAFAGNPALIVADEPTTALDVMTQAVIVNLLAEMRAKHNTAVILITHDLRLAAHVCDNMMVLYAGEAVELGSAESVFKTPQHPYTRSLQLANPPLTGPRHPLVTLPEHMPDLSVIGRLAGCRFAPRCPAADPNCAGTRQTLRAIGPNHMIRCSPACANHASLPTEQAPLAAEVAGDRPALLVVDNLTKTYRGATRLFGRNPPIEAVRDMSFEVRPGEFVGIVGESGSGKSTVAKLLLGLETPTLGRILVQGVDVTAQDQPTRQMRIDSLQMVFQDPQSALNPRRMVASIVTQAMEAGKNHASWPERIKRARELLEQTGLPPELAMRYPAQLSGGQRQRVNIARALCRAPKILVADEIVSGLDVLVQAQILNLLLRLRAQHDFALLFISHDLSVVRHICSRVLVMFRGQVVERGATDEVFRQPQHEYTRQLISAVPPDDLDAGWVPKLVRMEGQA
ncbi:MAG: ABC transporter ATP-binding protein, partial [Alphaproteobacteria bacterium]